MFNKIFTIIFVGAFFLGCGQEDNSKSPEQAPPPVAQKPLPAECSEQLNFSANWAQDPEAYEYQANYGVQQDDFFLTGTYVGTTTEISQTLDRGATYYIRITKKSIDSSLFEPKDIILTIPTCEDRAAWKAEHPGYEEPALYKVDWKKVN